MMKFAEYCRARDAQQHESADNMPDEKVYWAKKKISSAFNGVEKPDRPELAKWVQQTYGK